MPTITFTSDPAGVTLGDGLSLAARYWRATADLWMLPVALVAALTAVVAWGIAGATPGIGAIPLVYKPGTDPMTVIGPILPGAILSSLLLSGASTVAGWVYLAIAIAGLRGYRVLPGWILRRGVRVLAADLLVAAGFVALFLVLAILAIAGGPGLMAVVMVTAMVPAIYVSIRLILWSLAIFDGAGIAEGLVATWRITRGSVARMLGWGLGVAVVGMVVRLVAEILTAPLGDANPVRSGISAAVTEAFSAYSMIALAVIYESQRRRAILAAPGPVLPEPVMPEPRGDGLPDDRAPTPPGPFDPPPPPPY
jgi:hypothetical protein